MAAYGGHRGDTIGSDGHGAGHRSGQGVQAERRDDAYRIPAHHRAERQAHPRGLQRRDRGRQHPGADHAGDPAAGSVLFPARRRAHGSAGSDRSPYPLPVQGQRLPLEPDRRRQDRGERGLELREPVRRGRDGRGLHRLLLGADGSLVRGRHRDRRPADLWPAGPGQPVRALAGARCVEGEIDQGTCPALRRDPDRGRNAACRACG